jgi:hypothetical protein
MTGSSLQTEVLQSTGWANFIVEGQDYGLGAFCPSAFQEQWWTKSMEQMFTAAKTA